MQLEKEKLAQELKIEMAKIKSTEALADKKFQ